MIRREGGSRVGVCPVWLLEGRGWGRWVSVGWLGKKRVGEIGLYVVGYK